MSWDGQRIAFASDRAGVSEIYIMTPDGMPSGGWSQNRFPEISHISSAIQAGSRKVPVLKRVSALSAR